MGGQVSLNSNGVIVNTKEGKQFIIKTKEDYKDFEGGTYVIEEYYKEIEDASFNEFAKYVGIDTYTNEWENREAFAIEQNTRGNRCVFTWVSRINSERIVRKIGFTPLSIYPCNVREN